MHGFAFIFWFVLLLGVFPACLTAFLIVFLSNQKRPALRRVAVRRTVRNADRLPLHEHSPPRW